MHAKPKASNVTEERHSTLASLANSASSTSSAQRGKRKEMFGEHYGVFFGRALDAWPFGPTMTGPFEVSDIFENCVH